MNGGWKRLLNITVSLLTICCMLLVTEIILRAFSSEPDDNRLMQDKKYYEHDALLGWQKIKNLNTLRSTAGKKPVLYQINSKNIRGPEYTYTKDGNKYRILMLGDSFTEGFMVEFHDLFSEVLKERLNRERNDKYYEVINGGTCGWSTDQELLFFQNEGKKYNPDLTVLMFYENDVTYINQPKDWGMNYKPLFTIRDGKLSLTNVPVPKPDMFIIHEQLEPQNKSVIRKLTGWLDIHSYLYKLVKERIKNTYKLRKLAVKANLTDSLKDNNFIPIEYKVWEKNQNDTVRNAWITIEALLVKLQEEAASAGSKLLVFYVPFEGSVHQEVWDKLKKVYNLTDDDWTPDQPGLVLGNICKKNNIAFLNPTSRLRDKAMEFEKHNKRLYDPLEHHWSVEGNKLVGDILAEHVMERYLSGH